jgi:putative ABC transport system ATP-binding protein
METLGDAELTHFRLQQAGFIFQFFHLLPALTVMENLLFPTELAGRPRRWSHDRAVTLAEAVGLAERLQSYPDRLSGGEQQRVAIARSLMLSPRLLLADEPTGNLDSDTGARVLDLLLRLTGEQGTTLLLATHSMELAAVLGRRLELRDGRIVHDSGTPADHGQAAAGA